MTPRHAVAILLLSVALILLIAGVAPRVMRSMADFEVYWTAAARARNAEPLYRADDGHYQFKYLPAFATFAAPASLVRMETAKRVWLHASAMLVALLIASSIALLANRLKPAWLLALVIVVAMGKFYGHELVLGQVNLLFAAVVVLALRSIGAGREALAGALLAAALVVKPYAVIFGPWLVATRRWKAARAFAIGLLVVAAAPMMFYEPERTALLHLEWWRTVSESTAPNLTNLDNVSVAGMYAKWFGEAAFVRPLTVATAIGLLAVAALVVVRRRALPQPHVLEGALLLTLVPLLSPQGWDYVFLVSTPAIAVLTNYESRLPPPMRVAAWAAILITGLSLYDVMGRAHYATFMAMSVITVCFLVIVGGLTSLRLRGIA